MRVLRHEWIPRCALLVGVWFRLHLGLVERVAIAVFRMEDSALVVMVQYSVHRAITQARGLPNGIHVQSFVLGNGEETPTQSRQ